MTLERSYSVLDPALGVGDRTLSVLVSNGRTVQVAAPDGGLGSPAGCPPSTPEVLGTAPVRGSGATFSVPARP